MDKEQLDAMRTRFNKFYGVSSEDAALLLAEVERLTAERDALVQAREAWLFDCAKELRETTDDMIAIRKEHERAAFQRGAEAMREAVVVVLREHSEQDGLAEKVLEPVEQHLRDISIPEYKNV